jgi:hypothetical protein
MFRIQFYFASLVCRWLCLSTGGHNFYPCNETVGIVTVFLHVRVVDLVHLKLALINIYAPPPNRAQIIENSLKSSNHMENANILTLFWASFLYTPSLKSLCKLLKIIWSYSSSSTFSSNLALFRPTSGRGFASCFTRLHLRVFHTAIRYGKRHVKLIETSAEEIDPWIHMFSEHACDALTQTTLLIHSESSWPIKFEKLSDTDIAFPERLHEKNTMSTSKKMLSRINPKSTEKRGKIPWQMKKLFEIELVTHWMGVILRTVL